METRDVLPHQVGLQFQRIHDAREAVPLPGHALQFSSPANYTQANRLTALSALAPPALPRCAPRRLHLQPRRAASIAAMSIFFISIIASKARLAAAGSESVIALVSTIGVICQDKPHLSLHQPHALSSPPLPTMAFQ